MTIHAIKLAVCATCGAVVILCAVYASDSYARRRELANRLQDTLEMNRVHLRSGQDAAPVVRDLNRRILNVLETATLGTLNEPRPAGAMELDNPARLVVYWIEAKPSIDSIEVVSESGKSLVTLPVPDLNQQLNLRDAKRSVLFEAGFERRLYEPQSGVVGPSRARWVVLKRGGIPVSSREEIIRSAEATSAPASMPTTSLGQNGMAGLAMSSSTTAVLRQ